MRYGWRARWLRHGAVRQAFVMFAAVLRMLFNIISIIDIKSCSSYMQMSCSGYLEMSCFHLGM
ncbi:hypothetical protein WK13_12680, partial [Burkholderia ubonensis]